MPSTYTVNLGIEKPATGEQSGTWGDTTNTNFDILDQAINGAVRVTLTSAGTSGSPNQLQITNGAASDGRNKWIEIYSASDLGGSAYLQLDPNDAEKILFIRNSLAGSQSILLFQGTYDAARDLEVPAGVDMVVKFDGGGASAATVTDVYTKLRVTELTTPTLTATTADINGGTLDNSVIGGTTAAAITGTTIVANTSLNIAGDGATVTGIKDEDDMSSNSPTKLATQQSIKAYVDSQVGTVDTWAEVLANGATSGSTNPEIDSGQALKTNTINETTAGSGVTIDSVLLKDDVVNATDIEVSSISANDGTEAATLANSTGVMTIASSVLTTTDINGGSIDGTNIGASSAGTGAFTTLTASGDLTVDTDTLKVDSTNNRVGVNTSSINVDFQVGNQNDSSDRAIAIASGGSNSKSLIFRRSTSDDFVIVEDSSENLSINGLTGKEIVINNTSVDLDFRVESDNNANMLFVDAGNDSVNIAGASDLSAGNLIVTGSANAASAAHRPAILGRGSYGGGIASLDTLESGWYQITSGTIWNFYHGRNTSSETPDSKIVQTFNSSETVFNESARDLDFRVETSGNPNMLYIDGGSNHVNIGTSSDLGGFLNVAGDLYFDSSREMRWQSNTFKIGSTGAIGVFELAADSSNTYNSRFDVTNTDGNLVHRIAGDGAAIFNEQGASADFRVESDNNSNILFIDASADTVNIGNTTDFGGILNVNGGLNSKQAVFTSTNNRGLALSTASRSGQNDGVAIIDAQDTESTGGRFEIHTMGAERARFERDQIVFNESSNDQDFRVESDSNTHAIYMDAGTSTVGINSASTSDTLTVFSSASDKGITIHNGSTSGFENPTLTFIDQGNSTSKLAVRGDAFCFDTYNAANTVQIVGVSGLFKANNASQLEGGVTINDNSADVDFRVESNANSAMLFVDAGNNRVGVGTSSPTATLQIDGTSILQNGATTTLTLDATNDGSGNHVGYINVNTNTARGSHIALTDNDGVQFGIKRDYNSGSPITRASIYTDNGTTEKPVMSFDYDGVTIFNEDSYDQDFRVESDSNTHALFVEASKKGIAINDDNTQASGFDTTVKLGGAENGGGLVAYVEEVNVASGSYIDVNIGNSSINYWTGMLGVNNSSMANGSQRTQSLISILANNQFPGFNTSVLHTADGSSAASFTVTYVATGTIRITNTSGVSTGISAWFTGGGTQF